MVGAVVSFVDIGERKRGETLLRRANDVLEARVAERTGELNDALTRLRDLAQHLEGVREAERTRIARGSTMNWAPCWVALKLDTGWLARRVPADEALSSKLQSMGRTIDTAVDNLGRIITDLRPSILDHQGLWAALEWQAQEFIETTELAADLQVHVAAGVAPPGGLAIAVFRIFQEILSTSPATPAPGRCGSASRGRAARAHALPGGARRRHRRAGPTAERAAQLWRDGHARARRAVWLYRVNIETAPGQGMRVRLVMPLEVSQ